MLKHWLTYLLLRLGIFAALLTLGLLLRFDPLFAALIAAVLALAISLIFFGKQRDRLSADLYSRVEHRKLSGQKDIDSDIENQILDSAEVNNSQSPTN